MTNRTETDRTSRKRERKNATEQLAEISDMGVKQRAKVLRRDLKRAHGWTSKQVSVRISRYSMGESISVTIKDASVPLSIVEKIANEFQSVSRCSYSGEILSGGNTYVSVSYDSDVLSDLVAMFEGQIKPGFRFGPFELVSTGNGKWLNVHGAKTSAQVYEDASGAHTFAHIVAASGILSGFGEAA